MRRYADDFHIIGDRQTVTVRTALSFTGHEKKLCVLNTRNVNSRENKRDSKQTRTRTTISQWNSIISYEQVDSKFGTSFYLLINVNLDI